MNRRDLLSKAAITGALFPSILTFRSTASNALGGVEAVLAAVKVARVIQSMTGKPFRAALRSSAPDPVISYLDQNRQALNGISRQLDATEYLLSALSSQIQTLPAVFRQVVAEELSRILSAELGTHRRDDHASQLLAATVTFTEQAQQSLGRDRLRSSLDRIQYQRNLLLQADNYSILTLCQCAPIEVAAMRLLGYDRDQAKVVFEAYRDHFKRSVSKDTNGSLTNLINYGVNKNEYYGGRWGSKVRNIDPNLAEFVEWFVENDSDVADNILTYHFEVRHSAQGCFTEKYIEIVRDSYAIQSPYSGYNGPTEISYFRRVDSEFTTRCVPTIPQFFECENSGVCLTDEQRQARLVPSETARVRNTIDNKIAALDDLIEKNFSISSLVFVSIETLVTVVETGKFLKEEWSQW